MQTLNQIYWKYFDQIEDIDAIQQPKYDYLLRNGCGIELFEYQKRMLEFFDKNDKALLVAGRQTGSSTAARVYALLHLMTSSKKSNVWMASRNNSMSQGEARCFLDMLYFMGVDMDKDIKISDRGRTIEFCAGGRITFASCTESASYGKQYSLVVCDNIDATNQQYRHILQRFQKVIIITTQHKLLHIPGIPTGTMV